MQPEDVPPIQRKIVTARRRVGKPVVVATQMLESMITNPVPTRATRPTSRARSTTGLTR